MVQHDFVVFIGRFQPFHIGHQHILDSALTLSERVIVVIGSADNARSPRNPFTFEERRGMIAHIYQREVSEKRLIILPVTDNQYNDDAWIAEVQREVTETVLEYGKGGGFRTHGTRDFRVGLIGFAKDGSSFYLKKFPEWDSVPVKGQYGLFNATDIRNSYFSAMGVLPRDNCSEHVVDFMKDFRLTEDYAELVADTNAVQTYQKQWGKGPFVSADAVAIQSGHVLLIKRGGRPGLDRLALPGGFVNADEHLIDAAVRELKEETRISDSRGEVPAGVLRSYIEDDKTMVFDHPHRDERARIITHAYLFRLPERTELSKIQGSDDAKHAAWYPIGNLNPSEFYADHYDILRRMLGI
ncbi:bifunctional nicotinamide-nucleotide adenylyltransferase/Nudix hydroxylase [Chelatococcus sp. YT9]|uniref:bifunctional nicotinamide-nucleotide adenylyltransferase/Nudix hydroxylase n=1 Tax=Chelatococcus sp. YT9 TaxID=2835635 RepID=UPI001BCAE6A4|nr:bifunctional nicotinamide-nucleotide adenylyltransferase/Nudix hydroxylase [Chelatococcus sp. YT9]MBS7701468.1 bifunctional nicotinamide-nucleotide adenylyltransferase/Nudix hydroxylase [Chelatococcus sp. YT9]